MKAFTTLLSCLFLALGASRAEASSAASRRLKALQHVNGQIVGHCTVAARIGDSAASACDGITLILKTPEGKETARATTDESGNFKLPATTGSPYLIVCGTEGYELESEGTTVYGGSILSLTLDAE